MPIPHAQPDLQLAFDVGHSSIGWAVLQNAPNQKPQINLLGCGTLTFGADDCLVSKRRAYRRQRRHARSTRQRIARIEKLLAHLKVLTRDEIAAKHQQAGGHPAPWLLAARILASDGIANYLLNWSELWDVLRWYAHNRGYDGNTRWANATEDALSAAEQEEKKADTEKEKNAVKLMKDYGKETMAETVFADLFAPFKVTDPTKVESLPFFQRRFKANQCAFPRKIVEKELLKLLQAHCGKLPVCDDRFIHLLLAKRISDEDRAFLKSMDIKLPKRFEGGLLFGQLVPRFDNRIIAECPVTGGKVPGRHCHEFLEFRWAMTLANVRIGFGTEKYRDRDGKDVSLRPLDASERRNVDARVRRLGFLKVEPDKPGKDGLVRPGRNELREILLAETNCERHNLDTLLLHPDAKDGLKLLPIKGDTAAFRVAWGCFGDPNHDDQGCYRDDPIRHRFATQLLRQKKLTLRKVEEELKRLGKIDVAARMRAAAEVEAKGKKAKLDPAKLDEVLDAEFYCDKLKGRARYCRAKLAEAVQQVFHKTKPVHPLEKGGCLEQTDEIKQAALDKPLEQQTNNHLVRHRLLLLRRLHDDLVKDEKFANGDKSRIARITVEVARDLQTMSGMDNKKKAKELSGKIRHHHDIAESLAEKLKDERDENGRPFVISPGLIRKARVADDLDWECPYTGRIIEPAFLVHRTFDKDHIVPRSKRLSDALEALVITSREVNAAKKNRTAMQFIKEMNLPENKAERDRLGLRTEAQFRAFVEKLKAKGHPDDSRRRKRRKELLLVDKYEEKEFTPADLTKTRHIAKLAAQQLEAAFSHLPVGQRPPVISITGAVTSAFRDKTWKLLPLLGAANAEVNKLHEQDKAAKEKGESFNLKKAIREVTHLHHALDAISLSLITALLVPSGAAGRAGLNGELARLIHKGKLSDDERRQFEGLVAQLRLPRFFRWGYENRLDLQELDETTLNQIRERLAEKRVVQHLPADMSGLKVEENTRGIEKIEKGRIWLRQRKRDEKTGKLSVNRTDEAVSKALGLQPGNGSGSLQKIKGVRVISDNFGVAILDHAAPGEDKFAIIPWHKVHVRIFKGFPAHDGRPEEKSLVARNGGKMPRILRIGTLIQVPNKSGRSDYRGVWMIRGTKLNQKSGVMVNLSAPDTIDTEGSGRDDIYENVRVQALCDGGLELLKPSLTGISVSSSMKSGT